MLVLAQAGGERMILQLPEFEAVALAEAVSRKNDSEWERVLDRLAGLPDHEALRSERLGMARERKLRSAAYKRGMRLRVLNCDGLSFITEVREREKRP